MVTIKEAQQAIQARKQQAEAAKENLSRVEKTIPKTTQVQLRGQRGMPTGLAGRKFQRQLATARGKVETARKGVTEFEQGTQEFEQEFDTYLRSEGGKLQYAKEEGLSPSRYVYRRYAKGYALEAVPVYSTPYGEVIDEEYWANYVQGQAEADAKAAGFDSLEDLQEAQTYSKVLGGNVFVTKTGRKVAFNQEGVKSLTEGLQRDYEAGKDIKTLEKIYGVDLGDIQVKDTTRTSNFKDNIIAPDLPKQTDFTRDQGVQGKANYRNLFTGFALVSAQPSGNESLNKSGGFNQNGFGSITGNSIGDYSRVDSSKQLNASSGSWLGRFTDSFKKNYTKEAYNPTLGMLGSASEPSGQATSSFRFDINSYEAAQSAQQRGDAVKYLPGQYFGTIFNKQLSEEQLRQATQGNFLQRAGTFLDPRFQLDVAVSNEQLKRDSQAALRLNKEITQAQKDYNEGRISVEQYNRQVNRYNTNPSIQRLQNQGGNFFQRLAVSDIPENKKVIVSAGVRATQFAPYFTPAGRVVLGLDTSMEGVDAYRMAQSSTEKWIGGGQAALGLVIAGSGFGKVTPKITGTEGQLRFFSGASKVSGGVLGLSIGVAEYFSTLEETGSKSVATGAAIGSGGVILGGLFGKDIIRGLNKEVDLGIKGKRGSAQLTQSQYADEVVEVTINGKRVKVLKSDLLRDLRNQLRTSTPEEIRAFATRQSNLIRNNPALTEAQKTAKLKDLYLVVQEAQGNIAFTESGKVVQIVNIDKMTNIKPAKNIIDIQPSKYISPYTGTGQYEQTNWISNIKSKFKLTGFSILPSVSAQETNQGQDILSVQNTQNKQESKTELRLLTNLKSNQLSIQSPRLKTKTKQESKLESKQVMENLLGLKTETKQVNLLKERSTQEPRRSEKQKEEVKQKPFIKPKLESNLLNRLAKKADEGEFEAIAFRGGKEVSVGKGSKLEVSKALSKFLGGTLSASGFLKETKTGRKLKAEETGLLLGGVYRKSKVNPFLVVEKKEKRLRKGTTGKEVQYFRKTKKSKSKGLF